jgi:hypothetical protein
MPSKTVEFWSYKLIDKKRSIELNSMELQNIFDTIFNKNCVKTADCMTLDLTPSITPDNYEPKVLLDKYITSNPNFLFARICKKKEHNAMQRRDYLTYLANDVFTNAEMRKLGIEVFTYLLLDYKKGVVSIVNAQGAPGARILNRIFDEYNNDYEIEFRNIPNKDGIEALYKSNAPIITGYEFDIPTPNAEYLQDILHLNEKEIEAIVNNKVHSATLILRPEPYKDLESNPNKVREIIDIVKSKKSNFEHSIIKAKTDEFNTRNYDLHSKYFTYPIKIKSYRIISGKKTALSNKQMKEQFEEGLINAYNKNYELILAITNRDGD